MILLTDKPHGMIFRAVNLRYRTDSYDASAHLSPTLSGFHISLSSVIWISILTTCALFLASSIPSSRLSTNSGTTSTLCFRNSTARTAPSSTCENLLPGQTRSPADQGIYAPSGKMRSCSESMLVVSPLGFVDVSIKRDGSKVRGSDQKFVFVCRPQKLT